VATPVYSTQFALAKDSIADALDPVPPGQVWILRQVTVYNGNLLSSFVYWQLSELDSGAIFVELDWDPGVTGAQWWTGRLVLSPGQGFVWHSAAETGDAGVDVYLGGYTLYLP
jgi:hypothetical protein